MLLIENKKMGVMNMKNTTETQWVGMIIGMRRKDEVNTISKP
jgi:hypothetical protein